MMAPPPTPKADLEDKRICKMAIDIVWPDNIDVDVDLWVEAPQEQHPIGWSTGYHHGEFIDLVRDDLGNQNKAKPEVENNERACIRQMQDGEYIVNVQLYSYHESQSHPFPVPVTLTISAVDASSAYMTKKYQGSVTLTTDDQEETIVRFKLSREQWVDGSELHIFKRIVPASSASNLSAPARHE